MPGGEGALGFGEDNFGGAVVAFGEVDGDTRGAVARARFDARLGGKLGAGGAEIGQDRTTGIEAFGVGTVVADDEFVRGHAFVDHDIGGFRFRRGDADAAALSERVVVQSAMLAEHAAGEIDDRAGFFREIFFQKILHADFADEADALAVFFLRSDQSGLGGLGAHFALEQLADRKPGASDLLGSQHGEEIRLVLAGIGAFVNRFGMVGPGRSARVVSGADTVEAFAQREIEEDAEFYLAIAIDIGIGCHALGVTLEQVIHDAFAVVFDEIDHAERDAEFLRHGTRIGHVLFPRALPERIPLGHPVFHVSAFDLVALLAEQERGDGAVHPAGHGDENAGHGGISARRAPRRPRL